MSEQQRPVQVVQCPKCGSPVEAGKPGAITSCSYCGAPLQLSVGASGHPIARLANIETSTVYLARAEQVRRLREQVADVDSRLSAMREAHHIKQRQIEEVRDSGNSKLWFWGVAVLVLSFIVLATDDTACGSVGLVLALVLIAGAWSQRSQAKTQINHLAREQGELIERGQQVRDERDRLAARVAELEAGLDELADQL